MDDKIIAVRRMQTYIEAHLDAEISLDALATAAGYSKFHAVRLFRELTGKSPLAYARALRLTNAAMALRDTKAKVVDVAMDNGFSSHDGFTRAFLRQFAINPGRYSRETPPVRYFIGHPVLHTHLYEGEEQEMEKQASGELSQIVTVIPVERPARKMILLRSKTSWVKKEWGVGFGDYLEQCEELGCDWEGVFNSIPERFDNAAGLGLPPTLIKEGYTDTAFGVEVPLDYSKPIPAGYEVIELPPCTMLYFVGAPFENPDDFGNAIGIVWDVMRTYDPTPYGYAYAPELAPRLNFGADPQPGARMAIPARKLG